MALFVKVSSIVICLFFLAKVPVISKPLPFEAGSQTWKKRRKSKANSKGGKTDEKNKAKDRQLWMYLHSAYIQMIHTSKERNLPKQMD